MLFFVHVQIKSKSNQIFSFLLYITNLHYEVKQTKN